MAKPHEHLLKRAQNEYDLVLKNGKKAVGGKGAKSQGKTHQAPQVKGHSGKGPSKGSWGSGKGPGRSDAQQTQKRPAEASSTDAGMFCGGRGGSCV